MYLKYLILSLIFFFSSCAFNDLQEQKDYEIYDVKNDKKLLFNDFIDHLSNYDVVLLGEEHDIYKHHIAEAKILSALSSIKKINVALEMLSVDKQEIIDKALENKQNIKPKDIKKSLNWDKKWHQKGYYEVLESFFYKDTMITAANLTNEEIMTIYNGAEKISGLESTTKDVKNRIEDIIKNNHSIDDITLEKLVQIQQYKDRRMADVLVQSNIFSVLIAGKYHCYKNIGVPLHIKDFKSYKRVAVVSFENEKDFKDIDEKVTDFVWIFK